jgi:hypothetical protein
MIGKTLNEFAGMSKSLDDNEVIDKPDVVDRPNTDVNDLGDARKELLRIRWWDWEDEEIREIIPLLVSDDIDKFIEIAKTKNNTTN